MENEPKRVLLIENDGGVIRSVKDAINEEPGLRFVGNLTGRANLDSFLDEHAPDVALVDLGLLRQGEGLHIKSEVRDFEEGLWIIGRISQISPHTKIVGFSGYFADYPELTKKALDRGADALIAKESGPAIWRSWSNWLRAEINAVLGDYWRMTTEVAALLQAQEEERRESQPDDPLPLTARQMEVLTLLASGASDRQMAQKLHIEEGAVRGHISNIKKRMQLRHRWQVVEEARRHGIGDG
ncbi:MAG: response regulator transcription factor [Chloroflexi bacterium]|nr:response regulator transcription factor [Chloroflexota bacterium]